MAALTQHALMTAGALFALPDDDYKDELVKGKLIPTVKSLAGMGPGARAERGDPL